MALAELLEDIKSQESVAGAQLESVVSVDLFFDENTDVGSIGCNLDAHPGTAIFHEVLNSIREHPDVQGVWVGITEVMPPGEWPFSDHVYVIGSLSPGRVAAMAAPLKVDEVRHGWRRSEPPTRLSDISADRVLMLWWD